MESTPHIAIVDDHKDIRELVGRYLVQHGFRVSAAENGPACFASAALPRAAALRPRPPRDADDAAR